MSDFLTLSEFFNESRRADVGEMFPSVDVRLINEVLLESISDADYARAMSKLKALDDTLSSMDRINEDRGRLKRLVGKEPDDYLSSADTKKVGTMIANMSDVDRRNYVGIINFLGASCRIHHELKEAYINEVNAQRSEGRPPHLSEEDLAAIEKAEALGAAEDAQKEQEKIKNNPQAQSQSQPQEAQEKPKPKPKGKIVTRPEAQKKPVSGSRKPLPSKNSFVKKPIRP